MRDQKDQKRDKTTRQASLAMYGCRELVKYSSLVNFKTLLFQYTVDIPKALKCSHA